MYQNLNNESFADIIASIFKCSVAQMYVNVSGLNMASVGGHKSLNMHHKTNRLAMQCIARDRKSVV
jgi:hypothetical protein